MGITEDIVSINRRITALEKKQDEIKKALAVEEHKLKTLEDQLKAEGIDIGKLAEKQIQELLDKLTTEMEQEARRLKAVLDEAEEQVEKFQALG